MTTKTPASVFEEYQKARTAFAQQIADLAQNPKNIDSLIKGGVLSLLRPLLVDSVVSIQHNAATALGRLADHSAQIAEAIVSEEILPQLTYSLQSQNRYYRKSAAMVLRSVAKHSPQLAQAVVRSGALDPLIIHGVDDMDPTVKEPSAWAVRDIAKHNAELAQAVIDAGAIDPLVTCIHENQVSVKRIGAAAFGEIAKHTPELAQAVADKGVVGYLAPLIAHKDVKLRRSVCACLSQIAKHSVELAELVVEADVLKKTLDRLAEMDPIVKKNAATLIREIVKHSPQLAELVVTDGGVVALVDYITNTKGSAAVPGVMALGYIAAFSEALAISVINAKSVVPLASLLSAPDSEDHVKAACAWAIGQIGRHTPEHAKEVCTAATPVLPLLLECLIAKTSSEDLQNKAKTALKFIIEKCTHLPALEPLIDSPESIQKYVIHQFAKVLPNDVNARKDFVTSGGLQKIQHIQAKPGTPLREHINAINSCYPEEIVKFYTPSYTKELLSKLEDFGRGARA